MNETIIKNTEQITHLDCMIAAYEPAIASLKTPLEIYKTIHDPTVSAIANAVGEICMLALKLEKTLAEKKSKKIPSLVKTKEEPLESKEFLTTQEAAKFLSVSNQSLLNMTSNGQVPVCKLGRRNRYRRQDLNDILLASRRGVF